MNTPEQRPPCHTVTACGFPQDGVCGLALLLKNQASYTEPIHTPDGRTIIWTQERWNTLVHNVEKMLEQCTCHDPKQVEDAIRNVKPANIKQ